MVRVFLIGCEIAVTCNSPITYKAVPGTLEAIVAVTLLVQFSPIESVTVSDSCARHRQLGMIPVSALLGAMFIVVIATFEWISLRLEITGPLFFGAATSFKEIFPGVAAFRRVARVVIGSRGGNRLPNSGTLVFHRSKCFTALPKRVAIPTLAARMSRMNKLILTLCVVALLASHSLAAPLRLATGYNSTEMVDNRPYISSNIINDFTTSWGIG